MIAGCQTCQASFDKNTKNEYNKIYINEHLSLIHEDDYTINPIIDVWERLRRSMLIDIPNNKLVEQYRDWYIKNPKHLEIISERASPYLFFIVEELEKRDMPMEIALLPIIESSFDPSASSSKSASGLWQLTPSMAIYFGLEINKWYDGRRDVPASTIAALDMLEYLYHKTGNNWLYTFAAYNAGESRVLEAVKNNQLNGLTTEPWKLNLPKETTQYVPRLLALADVIKNADEYGITLRPIENSPSIEVININYQIDLNFTAQLANMTTMSLKKLNPSYKYSTTPPMGPHTIIIPIEKSESFKKNLLRSAM